MKRTRDPMAKDLRQPKYRPRVVQSKVKVIPRKQKHVKPTKEQRDD